MSINIENEYNKELSEVYFKIVNDIIESSLDFIKCPYECEVNVVFVNNESIKQINDSHRGIDLPTDVLSFPFIDFVEVGDFDILEDDSMMANYFNPETGELVLGDIIISVDKAIQQAKEFNHSIDREIAFLTAHSMLHLFGYDHIEDNDRVLMEKNQEQILNMKGYTRDYEE